MDKSLVIERLKELFDTDKNKTKTAEKLGVARSTVYYWLQGRTNSLDIDTLKKISKIYGVRIDWILGDDVPKELPVDREKKETDIIRKRINEKLDLLKMDELKNVETIIDMFLSK